MKTLPKREELARLERRVLQAGRYFRPEIAVYEIEGRWFVVKDCRGMQPLLRGLMGRRSSRREAAIYECLQGVNGIPGFWGHVDGDAFAIDYIEGKTLARDMGTERLRKALLDLETVLVAMHERKVVHLDLKQKRNILVKADDTVAVIDFQSAFFMGKGLLRPLLFNMLKRRDLAGLVKFKAKYVPDLLSPSERKFYKRDQFWARLWPFTHLVRFIRKLFFWGREERE